MFAGNSKHLKQKPAENDSEGSDHEGLLYNYSHI